MLIIQGSPAQRSYALLSGFGSAEASCSEGAMAALAANSVPDAHVLALIEAYPPRRASGAKDLERVLAATCRPREGRPCPPSLAEVGFNLNES